MGDTLEPVTENDVHRASRAADKASAASSEAFAARRGAYAAYQAIRGKQDELGLTGREEARWASDAAHRVLGELDAEYDRLLAESKRRHEEWERLNEARNAQLAGAAS